LSRPVNPAFECGQDVVGRVGHASRIPERVRLACGEPGRLPGA
jgi:hypothetical protein